MRYNIDMAKEYQNNLQIDLSLKTQEIVKELPDFMSKFFKDLKTKGMSERTRLEYAHDMKRFFEFVSEQAGFKDKDLNSMKASDVFDVLTFDDIQEYLDTLNFIMVKNDNGKYVPELAKPTTKSRRISSLRSVYNFYYKIGEIKNNMANLFDLPKLPKNDIKVLDKGQMDRILKAVSDTSKMTDSEIKRHNKVVKRDYAIMMLFFGTGIRVSELVGIDLSDIDFHDASIAITRKGGDHDTIFFPESVEFALKDYIENDRDTLLANNNSPALFVSMHHKRMTVRSVQLAVGNYAKKAKINLGITPHVLRKTFGTSLYKETGDIYLTAAALNHKSINTTVKFYTKMDDEYRRKAASVIGDILKDDK